MGATEEQAPKRMVWWHWVQLLSLDAPAVALAWQALLAAAWSVSITWADQIVLALAVWLIYVGDRWMDARRGKADTLRHRFYARHQVPFLIAMVVVAPVVGYVALVHLSPTVQTLGWGLAACVLLYLLAVHFGPTWLSFFKPLVVAFIFTLGCALVPFAGFYAFYIFTLVELLTLKGLAWVNTLLVANWERGRIGAAYNQRIILVGWLGIFAIWIIGLSLIWSGLQTEHERVSRLPLGLIGMVTIGLLGVVLLLPKRYTAEARTMLADLMLFLPAMGILIYWQLV